MYGTILVLAALIALQPDALTGPRGLAYVWGTALSTFVAHVVASSVGLRVRTDRRPTSADVRQDIRHAVPTVTSALLPSIFMVAALLGWLEPGAGLVLAIAVTLVRLASLGWIVGYAVGERAPLRVFLAGILLAAICLGVAILKWWLTR